MSKTRRQLTDKALELLGVLPAGQVAQDEDVSRVDGYIDTTIADLRERDIIYVPDATEVDESIFDDLALCLANNARHSFGLGGNAELPAAVKGGAGAEANLLTKSGGGPQYTVQKTSYF